MYVIDEKYTVISYNDEVKKLYPEIREGIPYYKALALQDSPCATCPLKTDNVLFYSEARGEWLFANAAKMDYPGHGSCYHVQFQLRRRNIQQSAESETLVRQLDKHVDTWCSRHADECIIGSYCEQGLPIIFANKYMVEMLGYESKAALFAGANYHVFNLIHPDDIKQVKKDIAGTLYAGDRLDGRTGIARRGRRKRLDCAQ